MNSKLNNATSNTLESINVDTSENILYTVKDIQRIFKIGRTQAYKLISANGFPSIKINNRIYVPKKKLENWLDKICGKTFKY